MHTDYIEIRNREKLVRITFDSIVYINTSDYLTTFYCFGGETMRCTKPLIKILQKLSADFYQINRSQVVNLKWINSLESNRDIVVAGTTRLTVANRRLKGLRSELEEHCYTLAR
ncbi:LytTR family transcriptional regulator [Puteibacter caeruleilacunae]|nr:LytTR family transcriptional regulator [Puteibacter caeruleilacunae]